MRALVIFGDAKGDTQHPLARFLKPGFQHCFLCVSYNGLWLQIDGRDGLPVVQYLSEDDGFDLPAFYREQGATVVDTAQAARPPYSPLALRNCVGIVKAFLCCRSWAVTPYGLYKYLENRQSANAEQRR